MKWGHLIVRKMEMAIESLSWYRRCVLYRRKTTGKNALRYPCHNIEGRDEKFGIGNARQMREKR